LSLSLFILPLVAVQSVHATELTWEGHYRARAELLDSLSLSTTNENAEGASSSFDHRLRLQPNWLISDRVRLRAQLDLLQGVNWGDQPVLVTDAVSGDTTPVVLAGSVEPPTDEDGAVTAANIKATRAWGEIAFDFGQLSFGRMPTHWGSGLVLNAGNDVDDQWGDTADRVQFTAKAGEVFVTGGWETSYEGFVGETDDVHALFASVAYTSERAALGTYHSYRWRKEGDSRFGMWMGDLWGTADVGPLEVEGEFAAVLGSGDLSTDVNGINISSFGGALDAGLNPDKLRLGLGAGFATGDADTTDSKLHTFSFDPDYSLGLFLFQEPMPTLEPTVKTEANGGRTTEAARTGSSVSNALYLRPRVGYQLLEELGGDVSLLAAQAAKLPESQEENGYGVEVDANIRYTPMPHFMVQGTAGIFFPGKYFSEHEDADLGGDFDRTAYGFRVIGAVTF